MFKHALILSIFVSFQLIAMEKPTEKKSPLQRLNEAAQDFTNNSTQLKERLEDENNNNSNEKIYFTAESSKALLINNSKTFKPSNYEISTAKDEIKYQMLKKVKQRGTRYYYFSLATGIGAGAAFFAALAAEQGYFPSETIGEKTYAAAAIGLGAATWYGISKNDEAFMEQVAIVSRDITPR